MEKKFITKYVQAKGYKTLYAFMKEKGYTHTQMSNIYNFDSLYHPIGVKSMLLLNKEFGMSFAITDHIEIL